MRKGLLSTALAATILPGCATLPEGWQSGDVIAIGTLEDQAVESSADVPGDLLGHGTFTAKFRVIRVVRGRLPHDVVSVRYFGHTYFATDYHHRFRLRRDGEKQSFIICSEPGRPGIRCD